MNYSPLLHNGVFVANLTPLKADLSVNGELLIKHLNWLLSNGADGIALLGTTGEANSFSLKERLDLIDVVVDSGIDPQLLMVGTGCCAYTDTIKLTDHALRYGVGGILMLPPFYYKQVSDEGLEEYLNRVIDNLAEGNPKIYLYHFPRMSAVAFSIDLIGRLMDRYPKIIVGMKDSSGDFDHMKKVMSTFPQLRFYAGTEKYLLDILRLGGAGCISATANVTLKLAAAVYKHWKTEDADELQSRLSEVRSTFDQFDPIPTLKKYLSHIQKNPDWMNVRPPNTISSDQSFKILIDDLKGLHFDLFEDH